MKKKIKLTLDKNVPEKIASKCIAIVLGINNCEATRLVRKSERKDLPVAYFLRK